MSAISTKPRIRPQTTSLELPGGRSLALGGRPRIMGVLNITPDSFSDGGRWLDAERAVEQGLRLIDEGAELLDLGAESTRPGGGVYGQGADLVTAEEELRRLLPVLGRLRQATDLPISVDTRKGNVARETLAAGADLINDISLLADEELGHVVAAADCPLILMHSRGEIGTMQKQIRFDDVVREVREELASAVQSAVGLGVRRSQIVVDPGIGFGKTYRQNAQLIRNLSSVADGLPTLLGTSRKSFIGHFAAATGESVAPPTDRLEGSLATVAWASLQGAGIVRVHDVRATARFLRVWHAIDESRETPEGTP